MITYVRSKHTIKKMLDVRFLQFSYGDYVYEYALKNIYGLRRLEGAYLNACYWVISCLTNYIIKSKIIILCRPIDCVVY